MLVRFERDLHLSEIIGFELDSSCFAVFLVWSSQALDTVDTGIVSSAWKSKFKWIIMLTSQCINAVFGWDIFDL